MEEAEEEAEAVFKVIIVSVIVIMNEIVRSCPKPKPSRLASVAFRVLKQLVRLKRTNRSRREMKEPLFVSF